MPKVAFLEVPIAFLLLLAGASEFEASPDEAPRSTVTAEAVERYQASIRARMAGADALPDKADDEWTSS